MGRRKETLFARSVGLIRKRSTAFSSHYGLGWLVNSRCCVFLSGIWMDSMQAWNMSELWCIQSRNTYRINRLIRLKMQCSIAGTCLTNINYIHYFPGYSPALEDALSVPAPLCHWEKLQINVLCGIDKPCTDLEYDVGFYNYLVNSHRPLQGNYHNHEVKYA